MNLRRCLLRLHHLVTLNRAHTADRLRLGCLGFFARLGECLGLRDVFGGRSLNVLGELLGLRDGLCFGLGLIGRRASDSAFSASAASSSSFSPATFAAATTPVVAATAANSFATSSTGDFSTSARLHFDGAYPRSSDGSSRPLGATMM